MNTTDSRVAVSFDVARSPALGETDRARLLARLCGRLVDGVLTVVAAEHRSHCATGRRRARGSPSLLRDGTAPPPAARRPTKATRGSQRRRLDAKTRQGQTKRLRRPPTE
ncbi:aminoacyl-tRNA hydrolase [Angustibacter aerolatus]|uniref:Aminoacyl-tRNA hydrolase n=1 Tax=Angustibacter aerolatus TaxID=1162965 RepID=A0ABQ6JME8_9ACTN|nr:aminoacyl-tRNA hydrolase [Angustibacter aerolatus]GMA89198.1 aminoacyl-tRNA hydrolase [Angustibacter aerolatus]